MAAVMIGVDPHKGSHTAVAISPAEEPLGELRVRACAAQAERLLDWAAGWPQRTWAIEGAGGLGHLLAQQLLAAGIWSVVDTLFEVCLQRKPETNRLVVAVFRLCVPSVNAVKLHVNDANVLVAQGIWERASDNRRSTRLLP
jgi:hypothetical protein